MSKINKKINISIVLTFVVYLMLIVGSSYIFYKSFNHYTNVSQIENYENIIDKITNLDTPKKELFIEEIASKKIEEEILMLNSMILVLLVLFLFLKRKYLSKTSYEEKENQKVFVHDIDKVREATSLNKVENITVNKRKASPQNKEKTVMNFFPNVHALVVEDNPINQKMIQHTLKNLGITVDCAENGQIGLEMYMKNHDKYEMVFMDVQMPVMNGIEATKSILVYEKSNNLKHTPIIAVTANALKGDRENFMSEGMDEYVSKPINLKEFIKVLNMFLNKGDSSKEVSLLPASDILLYKETTMEAKIIASILDKLNYSVDVVENVEELKKVIDINSYKCILLDKVHSEVEHTIVSQHVKSKNIPSLLFVDGDELVVPSDEENFTFISDKVTDYQSIKTKVDQLISLAKAS